MAMIGMLLGHRWTQTTAHYAHHVPHSVKSPAEKVANSLLTDVTAAPGHLDATVDSNCSEIRQ